MAHPAGQIGRHIGKQVLIAVDEQFRLAELPFFAFLHFPAEDMRNHLHPVTDPQHRQPYLEYVRVRLRGPFIINT